MKKNFALLVLSLFLALAIVEIFLRFYPTQYVYFQTRNVIQQIHSIPSPEPSLGYVPKPDSSVNFSNLEFKTFVRTNVYGMRDRSYDEKKPEGIFRILALGDSFVFGWGVQAEESISDIVEQKLGAGFEVLNLGVSGYSSDQILGRLRTLGLRFDPDLVVYFSTGLPSLSTPDYIFLDGKMYFDRVEQFSRREKVHFWLIRHSYAYCFLDQLFHTFQYRFWSRGSTEFSGTTDAPHERLLSPLKRLAESHGFGAAVIYIPEKKDFLDRPERVREEAGFLESECAGLGIPFFDLTPALRENPSNVYFKVDDHWTKKGHSLAAAAVAEFLKARGLVPEKL